MGFVSQENVLAANVGEGAITYTWQIMKMPGSTYIEDKVYLPYWERDIVYELDSLTGTCTYVVARCEADPVDDAYYTINNSLNGFEHTKPATETFRIKYEAWGIDYEEKDNNMRSNRMHCLISGCANNRISR